MKFYLCEKCKNLVYMVEKASCCTPSCCGQTMTELTPNTVDAALEKHVPVVTMEGNTVHVVVGSTLHPMTEAHLISFIAIETTNGVRLKKLTPADEPKACFVLAEGEKLLEVYEYCNLHGLWKATL